jgi:hypothetical protein
VVGHIDLVSAPDAAKVAAPVARDVDEDGAAGGRQPHVQIMKHFRPLMAASSFVTWTAPDLPIPWDDARRRLEKPDTVHGRI